MDTTGMLREALAERAELQQRIADVDKLIVVLKEMTLPATTSIEPTRPKEPETFPTQTAHFPKPKDAVLEAIMTRPGTPLEPKDVTAIVRSMGLFNPDLKSGPTAYTTALSRIADEPESPVKRNGDRYIFLPTPAQVLTGEV